jgi:hypothetical protein
MTNAIVSALEKVSDKLGTSLGKDGAEAVKKLYTVTGENGAKCVQKVAETDAEHEAKILDIIKKMDDNASKGPGSTALESAKNAQERANLRKNLADVLDPKSKEAKAATKDLNSAKLDVKFEEKNVELKASGSGATALGRDQSGKIVPLTSKAGDKVDVSGMSKADQLAALKGETGKLGDATNADAAMKSKPVCSCGLLKDDEVTSHTSMQAAVKGQTPNTHPALQSVLDDIKQNGTQTGAGHGKCGEVATISDALWKKDPEGTQITSLDDVKAALKNSDGSNSSVYSTIIGDATNGGLKHGDYLPPCNSCSQMLPTIEVDAFK